MRLQLVWNRLAVMVRDFAQLPPPPVKEYGMKSVTREYAIIQLYNFIRIREAIIVDFAAAGKKNLDPCLKAFWEPVVKRKSALEKLRNSYYAHVQDKEPFNEFIEDILAEYDYPASFGDTWFLAGCVAGYCSHAEANFKNEWRLARKKWEAMAPMQMAPAKYHEDEVKPALKQLNQEVIKSLKENNLQFAGSTHFDP